MKVKITLNEEMLGMSPANADIYREYIASKSPDAATIDEEVASIGVDAVEEKGITVFPRMEDGTPFLWDYQMKGFFKDTCQMLSKAGKSGYEGGKACAALKAYKKAIDGLLFVSPRKIPVILSGEIGFCSRPLRAMTMQGERVSLAKAETCPAGSTIEFEITCLDKNLENMVVECLNYGSMRGLGQWRNSGKGVFTWEKAE